MGPRRQFETRRATVPLLQQAQRASSDVLSWIPSGDIFFNDRSKAELIVCPKAGGGAHRRRPRLLFAHAAFCSVSSSASSSLVFAESRSRNPGKDHSSDGSQQPVPSASSPSFERLPAAIKKGDQLLPYVWDGRRISAMDEASLQDDDVNKGRLLNWVRGLRRRLHEAFLPDPADVTPDYWEWLRWRLTQRFFSSTMQNFSFSALLMATGLGAKKAFAASAAINWLLKDGVSRIVRMTVSTSFGQTFDADLKRMRFVTSLIFTACMAGEFATPFWPQHFVALASVSSVGRAIGLSAFVATQPAFQAALATGGNLADLTSKNQAQHMVMDMLALGVSAGLTWLCRGMPRGGLLLPAVMYPLCAAGDLTCIFHELKAVQLRTLNRERAEMVIERWVQRGRVPDAAEISAAESLVLPSDVWRGLLPLRITPLDRLAPADPARLRRLLREYDGEQYVLHVAGAAAAVTAGCTASTAAAGRRSGGGGGGEEGSRGGWRRLLPVFGGGEGQPEVLVSLSDRATPADITQALLHAAYLRKGVLEYCRDHYVEPHRGHHPHHHKQLHRHSHHQDNQRQQQRQHQHRHLEDQASLHHLYHNITNNEHHNDRPDRQADDGFGHTHPHTHWDAASHSFYHHTHYHTHQNPGGGLAPHTASLSLSQGAGAGSNTGSSGGSGCNGGGGAGAVWDCGGGGAGAAASSCHGHDHKHHRQHHGGKGDGGDSGGGGGGGVGGLPPLPPLTHLDEGVWAELIRTSRREAARELPRLLREAEQAGWKLKPFMLNTTERVQYVRL